MRLSTGEDLIGDVIEQSGGTVTIENPCIVYLSQNPNGGPANLGMTRWMPYASNKEFVLDNKYIVTYANPVEDLYKQYDQVFGSGLITPAKTIQLAK